MTSLAELVATVIANDNMSRDEAAAELASVLSVFAEDVASADAERAIDEIAAAAKLLLKPD